jgi:hypothetical protein
MAGGKSQLKRGKHGRHQKRDKMHAIYQPGPQGEPLEPKTIIGTFSNQCSCIVREKVPITYDNWKNVPDDLKGIVWGEMKRWFTYPPQSYDEEKCKEHALYVASKALRNFRSMLNKEYVKTGKTPFERYNFIMHDVWEAFVSQKQSKEAKAKGEKFSELTKWNVLHHHLGMTGYAAKKAKWREEERAAVEAGRSNPYHGLDERSWDYLYARKPKK